jgi:hypothetical protein
MAINSGSFAKALWPGVKSWYGDAYDEYGVEWTKLVDTETSRRAFEEIVGGSYFGLASVKNEGSPVTYDSARQGFTTRFNHVVYALGFIITREAYEDDQYDVVGKLKARSLAFSMRQTKEIVVANMYNRAFNTSYVGGDAATMIASAGGGGSSTHPNIAGGTWTNGPATAVDLSEAALEQAVIDIAGFTNDRGLKIAVRPRCLIIPKELMFEAQRILKTSGRPGTELNDVNAIRDMGLIPDVVVNHYLTDTDAWFIRTDAAPSGQGLVLFERRGDEFKMDEDFDTENAKYKASARYSVGWADARAVYGSPGA